MSKPVNKSSAPLALRPGRSGARRCGVLEHRADPDLTARGIRTLVAPDNRRRKTLGKTRAKQQHYIEICEQLDSDEGRALYKKRKSMISPVFGQIKHNRRVDRFTRRGLAACRAEWRLVMVTHNLLKLCSFQTRPA